MAANLTWKIARHARGNTTPDGLTILDVTCGTVLSANTVAARIWTLVDEGHDLSGITGAISAETGAPRDVVERDVREFLASLMAHGLIEPRSDNPRARRV